MWKENPLWREDMIAAELAKLGHHLSARTVAQYRPANLPRVRGQKWSAFTLNHLDQTWGLRLVRRHPAVPGHLRLRQP